ncbi:MAG TPA: hypothetical protein VHN37_14355 [Actinomycetota bacterium]|nr:hypothetical protein [Actinomycetota bacterium]
MKRIRSMLVGTCVLAACLTGGSAPAHEDVFRPAGAIVGTLPLPVAAADDPAPTAEGSADCLQLPRATADRDDFETGRQVHVVYLVPSDASDEGLDTDGTLECSLRAQNQWIAQQSGGLEWRFDTFLMETVAGGRTRTVAVPDITFVRSPQPAANLDNAGGVSAELAARGFDDPDKRYLAYVAAGGGGGACGDAYYPIPNLHEPWSGQYAQVYLDASAGCGTRAFGTPGSPSLSESVAQQELMHNDGLTPIGAPHSCLNGSPPGFAHVCTVGLPVTNLDPERFDVMYPFAGVPLSQKKLDIGHDDYFRHSLPLTRLESSPFLRPVSARPPVPQSGTEPEPEPTATPRPSRPPQATPSPAPEPTPSPSPEPEPTPSPSPEPDPTPSPSPEPADAERDVSLATGKAVVERGKRVRFSGTVTGDACTDGVEVVLEARRPSGTAFAAVATASTAGDGGFTIRLRLRRTRVFRAVVHAEEGCAAAVSREVKVRVRG